MFERVVVTRRRKTQTEGFYGRVGQSAFFAQIGENILVGEKLTTIKNDCIFQ
jgi:hypothetical protein